MQIKKISESKIKFVLDTQDLKENNIDFYSFMSNPIESQDLFTYMLDKAENELNFKFGDSKLIVEAFATSNGCFIFTITKLGKDSSMTNENTFNPNNSTTICKFSRFDDFCEFCKYLKYSSKIPIAYLNDSFLFLYKGFYYLVVEKPNFDIGLFKFLCYSITEFASFVDSTDEFSDKLNNYGEIIMKDNAISTCLKYF